MACNRVGNFTVMELSTIKKLISTDPTKLITKVKASRPDADQDVENAKAIDINNHGVMQESVRKKREVQYDTGLVDKDDNPIMRTEYEEVYRIPTAAEKNIVDWAVQMAASEPIEINAKPANDLEQSLIDAMALTFRDNKMQYQYQEGLRLTCTYTNSARIWYEDDAETGFWEHIGLSGKKKLSVITFSPETGDTLYPIWDGLRKMLGLGRGYIVKDDEDKDVNMFDLYFSDYILKYRQESGNWVLDKSFPIKYGKATFIYDSQLYTEWAAITPKRERIEDCDSDHADQNQATGSPILVVSKFKGLAKRGETGKVFEVEDGGKMEMLEAAGTPDSLKMERENLTKGISYETSTPDQSIFDSEGMGANTPGITIRMRFMPAEVKARKRHQGAWGMSIQREYNLVKRMLVHLHPSLKKAEGIDAKPAFKVFMPTNLKEEYDNIVALVTAGVMSKDVAIRKLAFTDDPEAEYAKILEEQKDAAALVPKTTPVVN